MIAIPSCSSGRNLSRRGREGLRNLFSQRHEKLAGALLQLCVFRFGFLQDGNIWVGVLPQSKKILIRSACLGVVALKRERMRQPQASQGTRRRDLSKSGVVKNFSELRGRRTTVVQRQAGPSAHIGRIYLSQWKIEGIGSYLIRTYRR